MPDRGWFVRHHGWRRLSAFAVGALIAALRIPLIPAFGKEGPFLLAWPAIMAAAYWGGFWPAAAVSVVGLVVGDLALVAAGSHPIRPIGVVIYMAFGLVFAGAGGLRERGLRQAREQAERIAALQAQAAKVGRLNDLGELLGGLAHELNQPLTAIATYAGAAQRLLDRPEPPHATVAEYLGKTAEQAMRARDIIARLRAQLRGAEPVATEASLPDLVEETLSVALLGAPGGPVAIQIQLEPAARRFRGDPVQVRQVLLNLIRNAAEAMESARERRLTVASRLRPDGLVEVCVADTGQGVSPEMTGRLFQPFATSKPEGMGLGLMISRNIVQAHGGLLWAESNDDGGATFRFTLPAAPAADLAA